MEVILDERDFFLDFSAILKTYLLFDWFGIDLRVFWNANLSAFLFFSEKKKERFELKKSIARINIATHKPHKQCGKVL